MLRTSILVLALRPPLAPAQSTVSTGMSIFNPRQQVQHTGLLLVSGKVYFGVESGWIFAYAAATLRQTAV